MQSSCKKNKMYLNPLMLHHALECVLGKKKKHKMYILFILYWWITLLHILFCNVLNVKLWRKEAKWDFLLPAVSILLHGLWSSRHKSTASLACPWLFSLTLLEQVWIYEATLSRCLHFQDIALAEIHSSNVYHFFMCSSFSPNRIEKTQWFGNKPTKFSFWFSILYLVRRTCRLWANEEESD